MDRETGPEIDNSDRQLANRLVHKSVGAMKATTHGREPGGQGFRQSIES